MEDFFFTTGVFQYIIQPAIHDCQPMA